MNNNYISLHNHTVYSLLDGYCKIDDLINRAKELNMNSIAITDHGSLSGTYEFYNKCKKNDIKPLLGIEIYYTWDMKEIVKPVAERKQKALETYLSVNNLSDSDIQGLKKKEKEELIKPYMYDTKGYHLILIAKNTTGWTNLVKLSSIANDIACYNGRGHIDFSLLEEYSEGLICTSACISGSVQHLIRENKIEEAVQEALKFKELFGDDYYLEIQPLEWIEQYKVNLVLMEISKKYNIKLVATNDVHYTNKEDNYEHDILLCVGTKKLYNDPDRMKYDHEYWLRSYDEMIEAFKRNTYSDEELEMIYVALSNTNEIANKCDTDIQVGSNHELLPEIEVPEGYTPDTWLSKQCWGNLYPYLLENDLWDKRKIYEARLKEELHVIISKGFSSYMLIVQDIIKLGESVGVSFGPGRGSASGSLVAFLLGIVKGTDPIEYDLLFFRFLTITRTANPDVDVDSSQTGRPKLIEAIDKKYGHDHVTSVGTVTTLGVKNGVKDVMRVLDYSFTESNNVSKELDNIYSEPDLSFKKLDSFKEDAPDLYQRYLVLENKYPEVFKLARKFDGIPRSNGVHAGGVIITPQPINDVFPTRTINGRKVTVWEKNTAEQAGGVKLDELGLKTISVIELCLSFIKQYHDIEFTLNELYNNKSIRNDPNVFAMLSEGKTEGVFQLESDLFKGLCRDIKPTNINDIVAINALGRPGPLSANMHIAYADRKNGKKEITYPLNCDEILKDSYGAIIYQEQCMLIAKKIAGFDDNQADTYLRKSLAKGDRAKMDLCREWFIYGKAEQDKYGAPIKGGINNGYSEKELTEFWNDLEGYASYLFNRSHSTSYSLLSCITAWLKYYYPCEYFAAHLTFVNDDTKIDKYAAILENEFNIKITVPDINHVGETFTPYKNTIMYGLSSIKGVGEKALDTIINARPYTSVPDFIEKVNEYDKIHKAKKTINKTATIALIKAGAFDSLGNLNRNDLINQAYTARKDKDELLDVNSYSRATCIEYEEKVLNTSVTYKPWFSTIENDSKVSIEDCEILKVTKKRDKKNREMAFVTIKKDECTIEVIVFANKYLNNLDLFDVERFGNIISLKGKKDKNKIIFDKGERK